ncbi:MAG: PTS transporter subunit EIIA [Proteobacteria bacterium]|nr:PTS transporter subunit EIIA [Pseudomonadota bacterium]NIS68484.1 PTS transporter subunit EIIA [Pseudomonadota bacterium]
MKLFQHIRKDLIITDLKAKNKTDALRQMALAFKDAGLVQNEKKLFKGILAREEVMSTGIGGGLAVAHASSPEMQDMAIGVTILSQELDFQSLDQRPVKVIFMIVVNDQKNDLKLKALAAVSRIARHASLAKRLGLISDSNKVLSIIQEIEGQIAHH